MRSFFLRFLSSFALAVYSHGVVLTVESSSETQLTTFQEPERFESFAYDLAGNRLQGIEGAETTDYVSNALNQYTEIRSGSGALREPQYDTNGSQLDGLSLSGASLSYAWDEENRLRSVVLADAWRLEYIYDGLGRRVRQERSTWSGSAWVLAARTDFLYDGVLVIGEFKDDLSGSGLDATTYTRGLDVANGMQSAGGVGDLLSVVDPNGSVYYPSYDGNGNVSSYADATGAVVARYRYGAFGQTVEESGALAGQFRYRFSTQYQDPDTGSYAYYYRHYDPSAGRWLSRDPIGEEGGLNLYGFVRNSPIGNIDRLGLDTYAIDGTYANVTLPSVSEFASTNVWDFYTRLDPSEPRTYFGGPGVTPDTASRGGKTFNGATGYETYLIVKDVIKQICADRAQAQKDGRDFKINLVGWSRGATAAIWVAKELGEVDCDCDGQAESLEVNFLGLYDAVEMIPSGPLMPGHRLPQWLPGDQGPPDSVPSNVQNFIHAQKTGGMFIDSSIPLPTTNFGHPGETGYPLLNPEVTKTSRRTYRNYDSNHGEIGVSPDATNAHRDVLNAASQSGVPIIVSDPNKHLQP